jgi:putative radical SAM enzyme (TIGR03279 family)
VIDAVEPGSVGARAGIRRGDRLVAINGRAVRDVIDVQFYAAEEVLDLAVVRGAAQLEMHVERDYGQELGLTFVHPTFDVDIRRCANDCGFCFVKQNPKGLRPSLYVQDDDLRYSFLYGHFVTLTNLTEADWVRLEEQRLSPLYVSVQATEPELRRQFLGRRNAPDIMAQLSRLGSLGIEVHAQVVLVPGLNDGVHLARTVADLAELQGCPVASVGVVPIGLTQYHRGGCRTFTAAESATVLDQVQPWRAASQAQWGRRFVYPSDEWYLVTGRKVPPAPAYDGFPQVENGVGLVRQMLDEWARLRGRLPDLRGRAATWVCGTLVAPVLAPIVEGWNSRSGARLQLVPVVNEFFGPVTTVSGLLTGQDVVAALAGQALGEVVIVPQAMLTGRYGAGEAPPGMTLDGLTLADLSMQVGVPVEPAATLHDALKILVPGAKRSQKVGAGQQPWSAR